MAEFLTGHLTGQKRSNPWEAAPGKAQETGPGQAEGTWTCEQCGNLNYASRMYCNLRKCQAPGPWTCPKCGNQNFAFRMACNKRNCGYPRPGRPGQGGGGNMPTGMVNPNGSVDGTMEVQQAVTTILGRVPELASIPGVAEVLSQATRPNFGGANVGGKMGGGLGNGNYPTGSWRCSSCGNINFPDRTSCNAKKCGLPRSSNDGGPPPKPAGGQEPPEGSWVCRACQNVNWPNRETCNKKGCGASREEADSGPPPRTSGKGGAKGGGKGGVKGDAAGADTWTCTACGNINFPGRTHCNMKKCGKPRY